MSNWFEDLTKTLAEDTLPRRQAIRRISGTVAGFVLASWLPEQAYAAGMGKHSCKNTLSCSGQPAQNCGVNKYNNCFCFQKIGTSNKGVCGCNSYCSSLQVCSSQSGCPTGYACITSTGCSCAGGVCILKCTKTCQLDSNLTGRTAADAF